MVLQSRDILLKTYLSLFWYILIILEIKCLVFIPRGHTKIHFPHNMQFCNILTASCSLPLESKRITLRRFISLYFAAVQLAAQDPHAIHLRTSGSASESFLNFV